VSAAAAEALAPPGVGCVREGEGEAEGEGEEEGVGDASVAAGVENGAEAADAGAGVEAECWVGELVLVVEAGDAAEPALALEV
jgi:hypothetical protein